MEYHDVLLLYITNTLVFGMILRIDTTSSTPVYAQIVEQVKRAVATGMLRAGDSLPSLRETAVKLRINPLTVSKAYKQLEQDGLIESRQGLGSFVADNGQSPAEDYRRAALTQGVDSLILDAVNLGVSIEELEELIRERIESSKKGLEWGDIKGESDNE